MNPYLLKILSWFKNKYVLTLIVFLVLLLFFDRNNLFVQWDRRQALNELEDHKTFYEREIDSTKAELRKLRADPNVLQNYARENLFMSKDSEDIFVIDMASDSLARSRKK